MVGQGIQKHNPDSIDEGYITRSPTPTNFEDGAIDEPEDEGTSDHNVPNKTPIDERYPSFYRCFTNEPEDEDALSVLNETHQSEWDWLDDHIDEFGNFLETINRVQPCVTIYQQVDKSMQESTLHALREREWQQVNTLNSNETTAARTIRESLELIALGEDKKIMFGIPRYVFSQNTSLIDFLVHNLYTLKMQGLSTYEKCQLDLLSSKISDLVSTGIYMSEEALKLLPTSLLEKHTSYLSNLK